MTNSTQSNFDVNWHAFQLNPNGSKEGKSKVEMYMSKFGMSKEKVMQMAEKMGANFAKVGLPYAFSDKGLTGTTFNSHRLIDLAGSKSPAVQDKVVEALFRAYFAEEKFLNDPSVLVAAAVEAGIDEAEAKAFVADESQRAAETRSDLEMGRQMQVSGVPYFVVSNDQGQKVALSGAQPPEQFQEVFQKLAR